MNIIEIYKRFPSEASCIAHLEKVRWNNKPTCPYCKSTKQTPLKSTVRRFHCNNCNTSYSVLVGTIFQNTKLDLQKWFLAISLILNAKKGMAARQLGRDLEVTKDTAWYMGMRIRRAMYKDGELLRGIVEMDETYIGGKPRRGSQNNKRGRGTNKIPVVGMIERNGNVRAFVSDKVDSKKLESLVRKNIDKDSVLVTDQFPAYNKMDKILIHISVDHSKTYVDGMAHTNNAESFWSLLKRGIVGQYHKVSRRYLPLYISEFSFRFNNRKINNDVFFGNTIIRAVGA
jgi:transposase-like protein/transcription elongation factor Elf1